MNPFSPAKPLYALLLVCAFFAIVSFAQDKDWRPVSPEELQLAAPKVEPDADAEVLFWEVRVDDSNPSNMQMKHYIRVKIFTERGREKYSKVDIPFAKGMKIKDIIARVIKPDGGITELTKNDVFDREIAKTDKIKVKAKSFAVPNIDTRSIFEYRYTEVYPNSSAEDMRMVFQHDVPIQNIAYYFKPYQSTAYLTFNLDDTKFVKDKNGFYKAAMENVPAIKSEPHMPPEDEVRSWLLLYYQTARMKSSSDFWSRMGGYIVEVWGVKETLKPGKDLKAAAAQITAGAATPEEQMAKIYEFCKTKIKNITYDTSLTDEQKEEIKPNKSPADTYKKMQGRDTDINELFASLADALGHETRLAFGGDRSKMFFNPQRAHESFVHFTSVAVKINGRWKYFSPGDKYVPYGMLAWNEENTGVLLLAYKDYITTETPTSTPKENIARRTGKFTLDESGSLSGTVRIEYSGHLSTERKLENYKESAAKREEMLKDEIKERMSTAEISDVKIENAEDPEKPFVYEFKVTVPNYAQKTGKRLFMQPSFFEYGRPPVFTTADRKYSIFFRHPWSEEDKIEISLPKGFELENPDAPNPVADAQRISSHNVRMDWDKAANRLIYQRSFVFGNSGETLFQKEAYKPVKGLFDAFHKSDSHMLTVRQAQ